jgi:hypothetical protein
LVVPRSILTIPCLAYSHATGSRRGTRHHLWSPSDLDDGTSPTADRVSSEGRLCHQARRLRPCPNDAATATASPCAAPRPIPASRTRTPEPGQLPWNRLRALFPRFEQNRRSRRSFSPLEAACGLSMLGSPTANIAEIGSCARSGHAVIGIGTRHRLIATRLDAVASGRHARHELRDFRRPWPWS